MNAPNENVRDRIVRILLGFEQLFPDQPLIRKVRVALDESAGDDFAMLRCVFSILTEEFDFPLTQPVRKVVFPSSSSELVDGVLEALGHLSYQGLFEDMRLLLGLANGNFQDPESSRKLLYRLLNNQKNNEHYCEISDFTKLTFENEPDKKLKLLMSYFYMIYEDPLLKQLEKGVNHFLSNGSDLQLYKYLHDATGERLFNDIKVIFSEEQELNVVDAFSKGQILSKLWLKDELNRIELKSRTALVLCGWIGLLPNILMRNGLEKAVSVDFDPRCEKLALRINKLNTDTSHFNAITADIFDLNYSNLQLATSTYNPEETLDRFDLIVNTSCEHIADFEKWYSSVPEGQLLALQTNDFFDCEGHVNCVDSLAEFRKQTPMSKRLFSGALPLDQYTRYMVIGIK